MDKFIVALFLIVDNFASGKKCSFSVINITCDVTEVCSSKGECECKLGYERIGEACVDSAKNRNAPLPQIAESRSGHVLAGVLVPLFLILVVIFGVFLNRRYRLVGWFRSKLHQRSSNYDEVMIGQDLDDDDPPLR